METNKTCKTCRFFKNMCVKFSVNVTADCKACKDYAEAVNITESNQGRMQLND